jgi:hypothetical protein
MARPDGAAGSIGRTNSGVIVRGSGSGASAAGAELVSAFGNGPTRKGAWGIFGQTLLRAKGLSSGSEAMAPTSRASGTGL